MSSRFFIERPIFASVVSIVIVIIGSLGMLSLPIARYPEIAPPTVEVTATYPGANATVVAETVASPIEQEVNGVEGMLYMSSSSSSDGRYTLTVTFEVGVDLDMAAVLVQNRVSLAEPKLPEEVRRQGISVKKKSPDITLLITLFSPGGEHDALFLNNYATLQIKDEMARIQGVGDVSVFGAGEYGMRIWLDPNLLDARGLTTTDVVGAIREQNIQVAAGQIGEPPAPEGQPFQYTVRTLGRLITTEQFGAIVVKRGDDGQLVRVRDVARIELGSQSYDITSLFNEQDAAALQIYQLPGANAIAMVEAARAKLDELARAFPEGLEYDIPYDSTDIIRASIAEVVTTLFITLILVVLTVYIFLQSFRATLIPMLTIPVSLIGTFGVMLALGFSINQLTLFGLVLVIGIVVDDAIVVVENVTRHIDESGLSPREAAIKAMEEVSGPVVATTLVLLAVFVPTAFLGGITGRLFQQFAITIAIATVFSSINALTMSPALAAILLRPTPTKQFILFRLFNKFLNGTTTAYVGLVSGVLRVAALGAVLFGGVIAVAVLGLGRMPTGFVPQEDEGWCIINVQLPDAASKQRTQAVVDQVTDIAGSTPGVTDIVAITGYSFINGFRASNFASLLVMFEPWDERTSADESQAAILQSMNARMAQIEEGVCMAFVMPSLPGLGVAGGFALQLQDRGGVGVQSVQHMTAEILEDGNAQSDLQNMYSGFRANVPQLFVDIDREQVKALDIPLSTVFDTLQAYLGSTYVNDFNLFGRTYQVKAQAEAQYRSSETDIVNLMVRNQSGSMLPLGTVVEVQDAFGPQTVTRHNAYLSAKITGEAAPGVSSGKAMQVVDDMLASKLPNTMGFEWTDISYQQQAASGSSALVFGLAVVFVYLVLAAQYESWALPLAVCLAVPTALLGAVVGAFARNIDLNVYTQIGIVLLIGLSSKSAILIVEFAKERREYGDSIREAALAASKLRFRAVLMTAFSFILGVIPLLVATGAGAVSRQVIGTIVFAGMMVATVVSVVTVPMLYLVITHVAEFLGRRLKGSPAPEPAPAIDAE